MANKNKDIFSVFFRKKPAMMLVELKNSKKELYASRLSKRIDCTYSHSVKILKQMNEAELVDFNKQGRLKLLNLTDKGKKIAKKIEQIKDTLEG